MVGRSTALPQTLDGSRATHVGERRSRSQYPLLEETVPVPVFTRFYFLVSWPMRRRFQIVQAAMTDDGLKQAAAVNPADKFELVFKNLLDDLFVERMDQNEEIFVRFMNDRPFQKVVTAWMAAEAYQRLRGGGASKGAAAASDYGFTEKG